MNTYITCKVSTIIFFIMHALSCNLSATEELHKEHDQLYVAATYLLKVSQQSKDYASTDNALDAFENIEKQCKEVLDAFKKPDLSSADKDHLFASFLTLLTTTHIAKPSIKTDTTTKNIDCKQTDNPLESALSEFLRKNDHELVTRPITRADMIRRLVLKIAIGVLGHFGRNLAQQKYHDECKPYKNLKECGECKTMYKDSNACDKIKIPKSLRLKRNSCQFSITLSELMLFQLTDQAIPHKCPYTYQRWLELLLPLFISYFLAKPLLQPRYDKHDNEISVSQELKELCFIAFLKASIARFYFPKKSLRYRIATTWAFMLHFLAYPLRLLTNHKNGIVDGLHTCKDMIGPGILKHPEFKNSIKMTVASLLFKTVIPEAVECAAKKRYLPAQLNPKDRRRMIPKIIEALFGLFEEFIPELIAGE